MGEKANHNLLKFCIKITSLLIMVIIVLSNITQEIAKAKSSIHDYN